MEDRSLHWRRTVEAERSNLLKELKLRGTVNGCSTSDVCQVCQPSYSLRRMGSS